MRYQINVHIRELTILHEDPFDIFFFSSVGGLLFLYLEGLVTGLYQFFLFFLFFFSVVMQNHKFYVKTPTG